MWAVPPPHKIYGLVGVKKEKKKKKKANTESKALVSQCGGAFSLKRKCGTVIIHSLHTRNTQGCTDFFTYGFIQHSLVTLSAQKHLFFQYMTMTFKPT